MGYWLVKDSYWPKQMHAEGEGVFSCFYRVLLLSVPVSLSLSVFLSVSVSLFISLFLCCVRQANWPASFGNKAWKTDTSLRSIRNQAGSKKPRSDSAASASHLALGVLKLQMRTPEPPTPVSGFLLGFWVKFRLPGFCS